ncbi:MotA/TolQ/ExbB proton channel family protein [Eisenibacter elegans]|uniref:MotA/TolQ/ExbB proton channel family protein n=1 Tax=Eisenibacter elegans TaxID=997 RepID=UPI0004180238|nr:MotA/TolQ/ExbB proton channel family protein [Eisenibacter elegans]
MKKLLTFLLLTVCLSFGSMVQSFAQGGNDADTTKTEKVDSAAIQAAATQVESTELDLDEDAKAVVEESKTFHQILKDKFIEGGWEFMSLVLICLILGLAVALERIITLSLSTTNTKKFINNVEEALRNGGVEAAKDLARNTTGPVASIFMQGLLRVNEGIEVVEKSVISYASVEMSKLEKGIVWISLFIALAPMLGFMGTVIGMIGAFDAIQAAGDISPSLVAGGIKVALLTTVGGLIVAIILQIFYNYIVNKVDSIVNQMEEASIALVDVLVQHNITKK